MVLERKLGTGEMIVVRWERKVTGAENTLSSVGTRNGRELRGLGTTPERGPGSQTSKSFGKA